MGRRSDLKRELSRGRPSLKPQVEEALKTVMCSVQTWDRHARGDEKLKLLEEHPEVYPAVVIRELKKSSRHGQKWFAGMMSCLADFAPVAEPLKEAVLSPEIQTEVKKELASLLSERGHPLNQDLVDAINKSRALSATLISDLKGGETPEGFMGKVGEVFALPEPLAKSVLREVVQEDEERALPLVRAVLKGGGGSLPSYLTELLATTSSRELHRALLDAAEDKSRPELHKAAKKAIYRLRTSGVELKETEGERTTALRAPEYKFIGANASLIDGDGNRMVWLARTKAMGGVLLINCMVNDGKGVVECKAFGTNKKGFQEISGLIREEHSGVEIDPEYCCYIMEEAAKLNAKSYTALPEDYLEVRQIIERPGRHFDKPLIYNQMAESEIYPNPRLLNSSSDLLEHDEFRGWFIPPQMMEPFNFKLQEARESRIILSELSQKERVEDIINRAVDELFQGDLKTVYRRRLEENAYILYKLGKETEAKLALVAAIAIDDANLPPHRHPFLNTLVRRSLALTDEESRNKVIAPP